MADLMTGYCVKCRVKGRKMVNAKEVELKGKGGSKRRAMKGQCEKCGTTMMRMLPKK